VISEFNDINHYYISRVNKVLYPEKTDTPVSRTHTHTHPGFVPPERNLRDGDWETRSREPPENLNEVTVEGGGDGFSVGGRRSFNVVHQVTVDR
jgi:hypothetical protein